MTRPTVTPQSGAVGDGDLEEGDCADGLPVGQYAGEGNARGVVDANIDMIPASAGAASRAAALCQLVSTLVEAINFLYIEMDLSPRS